MDILGYLKNTHKNPKFERMGQVPIRELGWEFPGWELSHFVNGSQYFKINIGACKKFAVYRPRKDILFKTKIDKSIP